jgi:hypothetical protein
MSCKIEPEDVKENISYIQDPKTDLCFAKGLLPVDLEHKQVFTYVPCTEKVMEEINKKKKQ